jgi:hypothetical protein
MFDSGGMLHFVVDEQIDQDFIKAIANRDEEYLTSIDEEGLESSTSELKNWTGAVGLAFGTNLKGGLVAYVSCYRSDACSGTANCFIP